MEPLLYDMHCHVDAFAPAEATAEELAKAQVNLLSVTVSPAGYQASATLGELPNVWHAAGLHPWGFAAQEDPGPAISELLKLIPTTRYIGEIGLDYLSKHVPEKRWEDERAAFMRICRSCADASTTAHPHILSIHSVRAASDVLDILEHSGAAEACSCIFHWFGGSTDELWRAIRMGCWFSCNKMMLTIKRSREYAKLIPQDRLLLETDFPPADLQASPEGCAQLVRRALVDAAKLLAAYRGTTDTKIMELTTENARRLLD